MTVLGACSLLVGLLTLVCSAREAWCHNYYPLRGRLYWEQGQPDLAATAWRAYLAVPLLTGRRQRQWARLALAQCLYRLGRWQEAAGECDLLLTAAREALLVQLGRRLRLAAGHRVEQTAADPPAEAAARATDAEAMWARRIEVERLEHDGDWRSTLVELVELERDVVAGGSVADLARVRVELARKRLQLGYAAEAAETLERIPRSGVPTELRWQAHLLTGWADLDLERRERAAREAESAIRLVTLTGRPADLAQVYLLQGEVAAQQGDYVVAMRHYQNLRECGGPGRWIAPLQEGRLLAAWGRADEAQRSFAQSWAHLPTDPPQRAEAMARIATAEADSCWRQDLPRAVERLDAAVAQPQPEPRLATALAAQVSVCWQAAGRDLPPEHAERLAAARAELGHDRHLQTVLDLAEADVAALRGEWAAAVTAYRQALARPGRYLLRPVVLLRLGDVQRARGDLDAARDAWTQAADCPVDIQAVVDARQRLRETSPAAS